MSVHGFFPHLVILAAAEWEWCEVGFDDPLITPMIANRSTDNKPWKVEDRNIGDVLQYCGILEDDDGALPADGLVAYYEP